MRLRVSMLAFLVFPAISVAQLPLSGMTICIDPGHGGHNPANDRRIEPDPGNVFWESEGNFQKALLLKALLEARGATVVLTRYTNDYPNDALEPSLSARVATANNSNANWFHSIHSNAFNGVTNYTLLLVRESSTPNVPESPDAYAISQIISPNIQSHLRTSSNYTRTDYSFLGFRLGVLNGLLMPGELSEGSFHDVFPETRRLLNDKYLKMEAYAIYKSFFQHDSIQEDQAGTIAGVQTESGTGKPINFTQVRLLPEDNICQGDGFNNGFFMFDGIAPGLHTIRFETPGYTLDSVTVDVAATGLYFRDRTLSSSIPPRLLSSSPTPDAQNVFENTKVTLVFSRPMSTTMSTPNIFLLAPNDTLVPSAKAWSNSNQTFVLTPSTLLAFDTTYRIIIGAQVQDSAGHLFDGNGDGTGGDGLIIGFRTRVPDFTPPSILVSSPVPNETVTVSTPVINVTFNERISPAALIDANFLLSQVGGSSIPRTFTPFTWRSKSAGNLYPTSALTPGSTYRVTVQNVSDTSGNTMPPSSFDFTVSMLAFQFQTIYGFNQNDALWKQPQLDTFSVGFINTSTTNLRDPGAQYLVPTIPPATSASRAMMLRYGWNVDSPPWLVSTTAFDSAKKVVWSPAATKLQAYMWGDGSGNLFRFVVEDSVELFVPSTVDHREVSRWIPIDWLGYRIVEWDFDKDSVGAWLGNGILEGNLRIFAFQLQYIPGASQFDTVYFDQLQIAKQLPTSVEQIDDRRPPSTFRLLGNYPNPFNPATMIEYELGTLGFVRIEILDVLGRRIRLLFSSEKPAGRYRVIWDGTTQDGNPVSSGVYLCRLSTGSGTQMRKMLLLK